MQARVFHLSLLRPLQLPTDAARCRQTLGSCANHKSGTADEEDLGVHEKQCDDASQDPQVPQLIHSLPAGRSNLLASSRSSSLDPATNFRLVPPASRPVR